MAQPRLTLELIPRPCWRRHLRSHLRRQDWERLREQTFRAAGYRCEICGGRETKSPLECNERWKYDDLQKIQSLDGLTALCPDCHHVKHIGRATKHGYFREAVLHLARVNGWSPDEVKEYMRAEFDTWDDRSQHEWTQDLSWLDQFNIVLKRAAKDDACTPSLFPE